VTAIRLSIIAAVAQNDVIGRDNMLPWRLPSDLKRFKAITMGKPLVMGRKTYESIGRPLPGRTNIVVSRRAAPPPGVVAAASLAEALEAARRQAATDGVDEVFVIGGAALYREALPLADRLYITEVKAAPAGDVVFFPAIDRGHWREQVREAVGRGAGDSESSAFVVYERTPGG
jgi:dihydrofolate reductase